MATLTGISHGDTLGQPLADFIHPLHKDAARTRINNARTTLEEEDRKSISYLFPINHNPDDQNTDRTTGPLRLRLKIMVRHQDEREDGDAIGLIMIGERRNAFGDISGPTWSVEPSRKLKKWCLRYPNYNDDGRSYKKGESWIMGPEVIGNQQRNMCREEFGLPSMPDTTVATSNIITLWSANEAKNNDELSNITDDDVLERIARCGAIGRHVLNKGRNYTSSKAQFQLSAGGTSKVKFLVAEARRAYAKLIAVLNMPNHNPATTFDPDSDRLEDVLNFEKVMNPNICGASFKGATDAGYLTSVVHVTPRDPRNGEFFPLSCGFIQGKYGAKQVMEMKSPAEWQYYKSINGRLCIQVPREFPHNHKPRFMIPLNHDGPTCYVHSGSGFEATLFGFNHRDNHAPRTIFSGDAECEEGRRQFLLQVDRCNASFEHWGPTVRRISQSGNTKTKILAGCERLGTSFNALPVRNGWEIDINEYYGIEFATITKFFENYNYCKPHVVDLNTYDADRLGGGGRVKKFELSQQEAAHDLSRLGGTTKNRINI